MTDERREAELSKLGMSSHDCYQFGSLFRQLAAYMTHLSSEHVTKEESEGIHQELLAKKSLIGLVPPTKQEIRERLINQLTKDLRVLELKNLQLDLVKSAVEADISEVLFEIAKLEAVIEYVQNN